MSAVRLQVQVVSHDSFFLLLAVQSVPAIHMTTVMMVSSYDGL